MEDSDLVSKCVVRVEVVPDGSLDPVSEAGAEGIVQNAAGKRKPRDISVETFPSRLETPREDWGLLPLSTRDPTSPPQTPAVEETDEIGFFSGNPFVEITQGILHLYKEDALSDRTEALTLCLLGIPASMTCHDMLAFTAPCHANISHIRVLRDSQPNQYMALLTFRSHECAAEFYTTFNGEPFNSLETNKVCHIVWVSSVEWGHDGLPPPGHTELPTCPVCLERMDESVDGVLTILCNHAFHANCLEQWSDSTCPVCRCVQSPEEEATSECEECGKMETPVDDLWICLICGHVGCGRYQQAHAKAHYWETGHCYSLLLGSRRVWDYKGDNFVHRLIQNKADGKLVPAGGPPTDVEGAQEKVDSIQLEYTYLLTSQLDQQRMYYEEKLAQVESLLLEESNVLRQDLNSVSDEIVELKKKLSSVNKEKTALEKKSSQQAAKLVATIAELNEERQLGKALRNNQQQWQEKVAKLQDEKESKEKDVAELKEQVRDLMFYINAQQVIEKSEDSADIAGGTVTVGEAPGKNKSKKGKKKR